jgi:NAD-dependent deacetylase
VAVLTGAGISAESGIPTFRDALTGLWARYRPEDLATPEAFARNPALVWSWYAWRHGLAVRAEPNAGHRALARLESCVPRLTLVTQNVDGLHHRAGHRTVWELHGSLLRVRCARGCGAPGPWPAPADRPPPCPGCGAALRPDVVWFGEALPADALGAAWEAARTCDVFLSVGTSNLVEPAASLPWLAATRGALVIVVNLTPEGQRTGPNVRYLGGPAGVVLPELVGRAFGRQL